MICWKNELDHERTFWEANDAMQILPEGMSVSEKESYLVVVQTIRIEPKF